MTTLRELLLGPPENLDQMALSLRDAVGAERLSASGMPVPLTEITRTLSILLDLPLGDIAVGIWYQCHQVALARQHTLDHPGERQAVGLCRHTLTKTWQPELQVTVQDVPVGRPVQLDLELTIEVEPLSLLIERGEITSIGPGSARATASLSAADLTLVEQPLVTVDLARSPAAAPGSR